MTTAARAPETQRFRASEIIEVASTIRPVPPGSAALVSCVELANSELQTGAPLILLAFQPKASNMVIYCIG